MQAKERNLKRNQPADTSIFDLQPPELFKKRNFYCLGHLVCGILLWQPWKSDTDLKVFGNLWSIKLMMVIIIFKNVRKRQEGYHGGPGEQKLALTHKNYTFFISKNALNADCVLGVLRWIRCDF